MALLAGNYRYSMPIAYTSDVNISKAQPSKASGLGGVASQRSKSAPILYKYRYIHLVSVSVSKLPILRVQVSVSVSVSVGAFPESRYQSRYRLGPFLSPGISPDIDWEFF